MPKKGYKQTKEHIEKLSLCKVGKKRLDVSERNRRDNPMRRPEVVIKYGNARKEHYEKDSKVKENYSKAQKKKWQDPEWKENQIKVLKEASARPETKTKQSEAKKNWEDNPFKKGFKGKENGNWLGGIGRLPYSWKFNRELKLFIRQRDNFVCQFCGAVENGKAFPPHHIDYDKMNCGEENLILLCQSCNAKANSNRERWQFLFQTLMEMRDVAAHI